MANLIFNLDASSPLSWGGAGTNPENWYDISGSTFYDIPYIYNIPTTVNEGAVKGIRVKATSGGTYPNGFAVEQRIHIPYGGVGAGSLGAAINGSSYSFSMWLKFNVQPISGSLPYTADNTATGIFGTPVSTYPVPLFLCCNLGDSPANSSRDSNGIAIRTASTAGVDYIAGNWVPTINVWYKVTMVFKINSTYDGEMSLFINDKLNGSTVITGAASPVFDLSTTNQWILNSGIYIPSSPNQWQYGGDITFSTFRVYQGELSASEISTAFSSESPPFGYASNINPMGIILKNDKNSIIDPQQAEQLILLRRLLKLLESQSANDPANRQRIILDAIASGLTLSTIAAVTGITNALPAGGNNIGSLNISAQDQKQFLDISRTVYNTNIRSKLTFS